MWLAELLANSQVRICWPAQGVPAVMKESDPRLRGRDFFFVPADVERG